MASDAEPVVPVTLPANFDIPIGTVAVQAGPREPGTIVTRRDLARINRQLERCKPSVNWESAGWGILTAGITALASALLLPSGASLQAEVGWWTAGLFLTATGVVLQLVARDRRKGASTAVGDAKLEVSQLEDRIPKY